MTDMEWYNTLIHPQWTPPDAAFAPIWSVLYVLMALSFLALLADGQWRKKAPTIALFFIQTGLNLSWSPVFFGMHNIQAAFIIACALWVMVLWTILACYRFSKVASWLLVPYLLWTTVAVYLNYGFFTLNDGSFY